MKRSTLTGLLRSRVLLFSMVLLTLGGCGSGDDGDQGPAGPPGPPGSPSAGVTATELNITVDSVTIASPPVVEFTVTNQDGFSYPGLTGNDLRFNIAKLMPGGNGDPSQWQNYINRERDGATQGTQERDLKCPDPAGGEKDCLDDHGDGTYTYTFATDITNAPCPGPCTDADGNALDVSYQPGLTHRVGIQQGNRDLPTANTIYDFVPNGAPMPDMREIVQTANCNECHNKLTAHGSRFKTKLCVTCHNPGSWVTNADESTTTVDFKVMIHKIHSGAELPSVEDGGSYAIGSHDFSDIEFPQDIRNCTKCHDGSDPDTAQGNNWQLVPNMAACGSCHDDISFDIDGSGCFPDPDAATCTPEAKQGHPGGIVTDNSECITCHAENRVAGSVAESHAIPEKLAAERFEYNLIGVSGGDTPVIQFSITDPTNANAPYDITSDPAFTTGGGVSRLAVLVGWNTTDFNNDGSGSNPAQPISINPVDACDGTPIDDWSCPPAVNGEYTLTKLTPLSAGATGTGRVGIEGHPAAPDEDGNFTLRVPVKSVVIDWSIDGSAVSPRREVVDIAKCDLCHEQLSLHGSNRNDEPQLCVICHNPNDTDINVRPKTAEGLPSAGVDGKLEESIDFKRLIHGIHGADHRVDGLVVYGFGGSVHDFGDVRFPGIVQDCETCHLEGTYELDGIWETPTINNILASTINTAPGNPATVEAFEAMLAEPDDDLNISPTAAVCSSCHDSDLAQAHMMVPGGAVFDKTQPNISNMVDGNFETCAVCHGPGRDADVEEVHAP